MRKSPEVTINASFIKGMFTVFTIILLGSIMFYACEEIRIGKSKEELAREMFVFPLIKAVQELTAKVEELETKLNNKES